MTEPAPDDCLGMSLVMPFVNVSSRGRRYDDDAYAAGWEMGALEGRLEHCAWPVYEYKLTIRTDNTEQADLLAMRFGYQAEVTDSGVDGWSYLRLTKVSGP